MTDTPLVFGYVRVDSPDDERLDSLRLELVNYCRLQGSRLVTVFYDYDPEHADTGWLGFAHLLNALHQRPSSAVLIPEATHLGTGTASREVVACCLAVAHATLWMLWSSGTPVTATSDRAVARLRSPVDRVGSEVR